MKRVIAGLLVCFVASVAQGDADELYKQGAALFRSDSAQAYPLFVQAAGGGSSLAMVGAGHCLENGIGTEVDYAKAIEWYEMAAAQKNLKACEGLVRIYASCPDPEFHDGEKAVIFAEVVVRKKPKNAEALSLLAAAYARNLEFEKAARTAKQAKFYVHDDEAKNTILQQIEGYEQGRPYPAMATEEWMMAAMTTGRSTWAANRVLWRLCERGGPYYNPKKAIEICHMLIGSGQTVINRELAGLYVDMGQLKKAHKCLDAYQDEYQSHDMWKKSYEGELGVFYFLAGKYSADNVYAAAQRYVTGFSYETVSDEGRQSTEYKKANLAAAYFLFRTAVQKKHPEAPTKLAELEQEIGAYRKILENETKLSNQEVATALANEASKLLLGKDLPQRHLMAIGLYWEAYRLNPSAEYETAIERLVETLSL